MAAHHLMMGQDEDDYDDYDQDDDDDQGEEDDWGLSSSPSPVPHQRRREAPDMRSGVLKTSKPILSSPQCSMDDDSSTESEGEVAGAVSVAPASNSRAPFRPGMVRRAVSKQGPGQMASSASRVVSTPSSFTSSEQQPGDFEHIQVTTVHQRRAKIKELELKYHQECVAHCRTLLALQRQWRQELDDPVPGLISFDLQQEEMNRQKDISPSKLDVKMQSSLMAVPKSKSNSGVTPHLKNGSTADISSSLKGPSRGPLRRRVAWRANEREALRRGILMFGLGRSEKVRGIMRGSLKQMHHGLGDIADCCWEFVRACSVYSEQKEAAYVEKLFERAKDLGIEMGPEVTERVGQWEKIEKSGSVWLKRIRLLDNLGHVVRLCANPETQENAYNAIDSLGDATLPCDWWSRESDLALLAGIYKHGFGGYEALRTDQQFAEAFGASLEEKGSVSGHKAKSELLHSWDGHGNEKGLSTARDGDSSFTWPDSNILTRRLKRLVEHIGRVGEQPVNVQKGSGRKVRQGQTWSKREKLNFLRILLIWGLPFTSSQGDQVCWQFFQDQASVRPLKIKKESSLQACYDGLVKEMTQLLEGSDSQEKAQHSGSVDHEGSSDDSDEKNNIDIGEASEAGPAVLTQKTALRLRDRLQLFEAMRHGLDLLSEDWTNIGLSIHQSHNMPSWWQSGSHDRQLVLGVLKHGFGNWDAIFEDKTYSFKAESEKEKFRKGITQDGENQGLDSWRLQSGQENEDRVKAKGKRSFCQGGSGPILPSPKSCTKRLKFVGYVVQCQLQKHFNWMPKSCHAQMSM